MANDAAFAHSEQLEQDSLIELYILDLSDLGGDILRFYSGTDQNNEPIKWQGVVYTSYPVEVKGYDVRSQGTIPTPSVAFGNVNGYFSALCLAYNDCLGASFTRKRTFSRFLDGKPTADPTACFLDDIYYVNQRKEETNEQVTFDLASNMEVDDISLPRRRIIANLCTWKYRGAECSFIFDTVVADSEDNDIPLSPRTSRGLWNVGTTYHFGDYVYIVSAGVRRYFWLKNMADVTGIQYAPPNANYWIADECAKRVLSCQKRFSGRAGGLPHGGFPAVERLPL